MASPLNIKAESGGQFPLSESTKVWTSLWSTMTAIGWSPTKPPYRSSHPVRVTFRNGPGSFSTTLMPNPQFYELIMGWPIGWTAPGAPVTGYAAWLQRSRGQFSKLFTSWTPADL